jgi:hypothetical protein
MGQEFRAFLEGRKLAPGKIELMIITVKDLERYLEKINVEL